MVSPGRFRPGSQPVRWLAASVLALAASAACAQVADVNPAAVAELYLEVSIDGRATGAVLPFRRHPDGRLVGDLASLREAGLDTARLQLPADGDVELGAIKGLRFSFNPATQSVDLHLEDVARDTAVLTSRPARAVEQGSVSPGFVLNYDLYGRFGRQRGLSALNEVRWFGEHGVVSSSGNLLLAGGERRYVRYDSTWTRSDPGTLSTLQIGDFVTPSLNWSRSYRMAGVEWRKNFDLRPDLLTYPVASVASSAVVPSKVSLYVNGVQQMARDVGGGPFIVDGITGLNGAGQATIVTQDALGRNVERTVPLYVDTRLMAAGLSDFAVSAGMLRRDYGLESFHYAKTPVASASLRHGLSDILTLEAHAEGGRSQVAAGMGALLRLGMAGVASASLAGSAGRYRGAQVQLGYQYISQRIAVDVQSMRASKGYGDLGSLDGQSVNRAADRVSTSWSQPLLGSVSANYFRFLPGAVVLASGAAQVEQTRLVSLAWSRALGLGAYLSVSAFHDLDRPTARGVMASLSFSLGSRVSSTLSGGRQNGVANRVATMSRAPDFGGGFGWGLQSGASGASRYDQAQLQYLGAHGLVNASVNRAGGETAASAGMSGALVAMDGALLPARQVGNAFVLVSTGLPGVPVLQENRPIGVTDANGRILLPNLIPYSTNLVAIDTAGLPADLRVRSSSMQVVPRALSGVQASFPVERYRAATVILHDVEGKPVAPGTRVRVVGATEAAETIAGYDGMVFVEGLSGRTRLRVGSGAAACEVVFDYASDSAGIPTIGPLRCLPAQAP